MGNCMKQRSLIDDDDDVGIPVGIPNAGNTCFISSSIQCLSHIPFIAQYITRNDDNDDDDENTQLWREFRVLAMRITANERSNNSNDGHFQHHHTSSSLDIRQFSNVLSSVMPEYTPRSGGGYAQQHDAYKFMLEVLLARLHTAIRRPPTATTSSASTTSHRVMHIDNINMLSRKSALFDAKYERCREIRVNGECVRALCEHKDDDTHVKVFELLCRRVASAFVDRRCADKGVSIFTRHMRGQYMQSRICPVCASCIITFPLFYYYELPLLPQKGTVSIDDLLQHSVHTPKPIDTMCNHCGERRSHQQYRCVLRVPGVITLRFVRAIAKRSKPNEFKKRTDAIVYPLDGLTMHTVMYSHRLWCIQHADNPTTLPSSSSTDTNPSYKLYSVLEHHGWGASRGHYVACVRHLSSERMYTVNDRHVNALAADTDGTFKSEHAYVLFYGTTAMMSLV